jgi:hypothetical protein
MSSEDTIRRSAVGSATRASQEGVRSRQVLSLRDLLVQKYKNSDT